MQQHHRTGLLVLPAVPEAAGVVAQLRSIEVGRSSVSAAEDLSKSRRADILL
jgi:hypothetical protein